MQLSQARDGYLRWLLATRDLSPHTVRAYEGDLVSFERFANTGMQVADLDRSTLLEFLESQRALALSPASLRRRASALRGFSRWLVGQGLIANDPWLGASVATGRGRKLPRVLPTADLDRLLTFLRQIAGLGPDPAHPALVHDRPHESTTLLAVALMVSTGARVHEVVGFRHQDVDLSGRAIRLVGKGRHERQVFLANDWIAGLTEAYLQVRTSLALTHPRLLFNLHYDPLTTAAMRSRLAKVAKAAGITQHVTPHMLRHTAATQLIEAGVDIRYIQRLLGHASLSTTEIYTHVSDRALKRVVSEADILGRLREAR
ncbi:MAG TPA: tyrosine-type recombinase/integrase [Solirubrobacterales bacterium]|nr:tyrosine-type recombinase/integrase [Solirubrobacterales bacterium]